MKSQGVSTLGGLEIYYDDSIGRLNKDNRGKKLGVFTGDDSILVIYKEGTYELTNYELTNRYDESKVALIEKFHPESVITCIYFDGENKVYYLKRFQLETTTLNKSFLFISESRGSKLEYITTVTEPVIEYQTKGKKGSKSTHEANLAELIDVKGWKAIGNKFSSETITKIIDKSTDNELNDDQEVDEDEITEESKTVYEEKKPTSSKNQKSEESYEVGDTIDLDIDPKDDKDQLDLFQ